MNLDGIEKIITAGCLIFCGLAALYLLAHIVVAAIRFL